MSQPVMNDGEGRAPTPSQTLLILIIKYLVGA